MKKTLLLLWIVPCLVFSQGKTIAFQKNMKIFNGQQSSYFLDTTSTSQDKNGQLTLNTLVTDSIYVLKRSMFDSTVSIGSWGYTGEHIILPESSSNTNAGLGLYSMVNSSATAGKVFAGTYSRMLAMTTNQANQSTMVGAETQFRLRDVDIADGVHAGLWAYAEQSGTSALTGGGTFDAISATVESEAGFTVGATEQVTGITVDASIHASATINASANYSGIYIKSSGKDWFNGIKITGATNDIELQNGGKIHNTDADTLTLLETIVQVDGILNIIDLKTSTTTVLTPTSTGNVDTLETDDIGDIAFTLSGGMTYVSTEGLMTIGTGGTFERLNEGNIAYTGAHLHDFTHDDGRLTYTGTNTKCFTINISINIEGEEANQRVEIQLYKDGALITEIKDRHDFTAVDTDDSVGFTWLLDMATNEYVEIHGTSDVNADEFTVLGGSMVISQH